MAVLYVCMYVCPDTVYVPVSQGDQKRMSYCPLELELLMVVSCHVAAENQTPEEHPVSLTPELSPALAFLVRFFDKH